MANTSFSSSNFSRPAPKWWRKLEDGLLMILIPATVAILMGWGFSNEAMANKIILIINTGLVALIKFIGKMLANGEEYAPANPADAGGPGGGSNPPPPPPPTGN